MALFLGRITSLALRVLAKAGAMFAVLLAFAAPALAGSVTLAWDPVTSPLLAGYVIHYGPSAGSYTGSVDVGNVTTYTVSTLTEGVTYHFAVAAYNSAHVEGGLSNDVAATIPYTVPVANFSASTVSGPAPLALNFINTSTGTITSHAWTFGDGTTSTVANPTKVYSAPGTFTVGLTVTGPGGSNIKTRPNYITVTATTDTTPPSAPGSPVATATGSTAINLSWTAATDSVGVTGYKVERCLGASCTTFAQIATPTGTSYSDSGLASSTTYRYRVRATDAAGNLGAYSAIASATTSSAPDTTPPSAPGSPVATATGSTAINLSWTAATDSVGVTGYKVERCLGASCTTFAQIATPTGTSYSDSGLAASTTYRYRVRATDAAGNLGAYSAIASATTSSAPDTTPPSAPGSPVATATGSTAINLSWTAATDSVGVTGYKVERCLGASCTTFAQIATPTGTSYSDSGLAASTTYRYRVRATDAAGNLGAYSAIASATTSSAPDTTPPSAPGSPVATATGSTTISLTWTAATDNVGVTGYRVERCLGASCTTFAQIATPTGTSYSDSGLAASTTYRYRVRATDAAGNLGAYSAIASATTSSAPDTTPPSAPGSPVATATGSSAISLTWTAATDNVGVTGYRVERCLGASCTTFAQIATPTGTSYSDSGLAASTTYRYRVRATDAAGNLGAYSAIASATTSSAPDTTPPSAPGSPVATATGSTTISLTWTAATDNVGVTGYRVERCLGASCTTFAQIATPTGTSYSDSGLAASTTYRYRVRATDAAGNLGAYSAIASATTSSAPDTTPPSAPGSPVATATGSTTISLTWTAATDNVGVTGYRVERCLGASCTTFAQIATPTGTSYSDSGLAASTTYRYRVRATDAAGNLGAYSNTASATTPTSNTASATTPTLNGLVAGYAISEGSGTTTADASGSGMIGTLVGGPTWVGGKNGTGLSFNGASTHVDLGTSAALGFTGSMTLSAWVYETGNVGDDGQIVAKSDGASGWQLKSTPDTGVRTFGIAITNTSGVRVQRYSSTVRALNTWYHVAGVYDATAQTLNIDVNGMLNNGVLSGAVPTSQRASTVATNIGRRTGGFNIQGIVDDVRIYGRALSVAEIQADMATPVH